MQQTCNELFQLIQMTPSNSIVVYKTVIKSIKMIHLYNDDKKARRRGAKIKFIFAITVIITFLWNFFLSFPPHFASWKKTTTTTTIRKSFSFFLSQYFFHKNNFLCVGHTGNSRTSWINQWTNHFSFSHSWKCLGILAHLLWGKFLSSFSLFI